MCGRYTLTRHDGVIEEMGAILDPQIALTNRFNIAPTQPAPIVIQRDGVRVMELFRWGLVPHWALHPEPGGKRAPLMINARVETVLQKPVFARAFRKRRILVPADGFFEWKRAASGSGRKEIPQPLYIRPVPHRYVAFAGIAIRAVVDARSAREGGKSPLGIPTETGDLFSFAILTGPPNELVAPIHDRMPVVLHPADYSGWLDPGLDEREALAMLTIPPVDDWRADHVSTAVNKAANDDPSCIELVAPPAAPAQRSLF